ncbi:hypothetical protein ACMU_17465 [Actibacterium mucosum KCTC 23349]|uniref:Colicin transporter n=1 Tax=Actibacterium mucosum KCTC 23349 TaxID=1454373 RepID=A0A037ZEE5_9RHOB|nr:hypothetical protein [Actibacterium mucosum]KAJ54497.1 hypothetical protein ACMU_17465 [Actibacterium mucosum KCTC 23349]
MSDISEFEQRITAALKRIGQGMDALSAAPETPETAEVDTDALAAAQEALEAEKMANAQLEERVKAIREKQDSQVANLEREVAHLRVRNDEVEAEIAGLKAVTAKLRRLNQALRAANAEGVGDAELINQSLQTELDALATLRDGDRAEIDAVLATIEPLAQGEQNA